MIAANPEDRLGIDDPAEQPIEIITAARRRKDESRLPVQQQVQAMDITHLPETAMKQKWAMLAKEIARRPYRNREKGRLVVLGSGMAFMDFMRDSDPEIRSADHVFHCLYDKVTQAWIGKIRPDSYDLRILYGPDIDRYCTYVQMAEAMLHYVRLGRKVVAVFYGHPGIYAMPAHRAIHIARSEGHEALMRPGISALDYLVADIGFDPALPGMLNYEATDLLLRQRRIDPTLHVVLWQVGVVGEFQFAPRGYENKGYDFLAQTLLDVYGPDWNVTHYIAPQYVGIEPLIEQIPISGLLEPEARSRITALSTFYIEPQVEVATDPEMSVALGQIQPGQIPPAPKRSYGHAGYGRRERNALTRFSDFQAPGHYSLTQFSPVVDFMLTLSGDLELQARYRQDPVAVVNDDRFGLLSERARKLLAIPHPRAINAALVEAETQDDRE